VNIANTLTSHLLEQTVWMTLSPSTVWPDMAEEDKRVVIL